MLLAAFLLACAAPAEAPPAPTPPADPVPVAAPAPAPLPDPTEPRYAASHILVAHAGAIDAVATRSEAEAEALAATLRERALAGEAFDDLAREHSDGPSAPRGGRLGVYSTGTMVPDFERAVASVDPGTIGPLVHTPFGWHVVRRDAVVEAEARHILIPFEGAWRSRATRTRDEALARAAQARRDLVEGGKSFEDVALAYSEDATAAHGGALGRVAPGQMIPAFEEALFALPPGQLSEPVETPYGIHIIERLR